MVDDPAQRTSRPILRWIIVILWWLTLFVLVMMMDINDEVLFALVVSVVPGILLALFILAVAAWMLIAALLALWRRRWRTAAFCVGALAASVLSVFAGQFAGDQWQIRVMGAGLAEAVEQAKAGKAAADPIEATPAGAYIKIGAFFDTEQGIAFDTTDRLGDMLALEMGERPDDWLDRMPRAFSCSGGARHLGGHYWKTNLDPIECARDADATQK
jgi:hypothetical protein